MDKTNNIPTLTTIGIDRQTSKLIDKLCKRYSLKKGEIVRLAFVYIDKACINPSEAPESVKFSYISKFHIIISCKLIVYIVMCFYQETNQEQKHELSYFLVFLFALPFFLFTCSYFEYFSKSFHTIFILSPRVIVAVIYG